MSAAIYINAASAADIDTVLALKEHGFEIVRYRDKRGAFDTLRQLNKVPGLTCNVDGFEDELQVTYRCQS